LSIETLEFGSAVFTIDVANQQSVVPLDQQRLREAVRAVLGEAGMAEARISLAVVDDPTIARLNQEFLAHQGPTDVLSFPLERTDGYLEGEIVVSAETAARAAPQFGWTAGDELLLYVIHGALHLVGYDDATPAQRAKMRRREKAALARCGIDEPQRTNNK
jgi:probable rRNA maturation factor